jgi:hypothetical protein
MEKEITIWFDKEGDYLEVMFEKRRDTLKRRRMMLLCKKSMRYVNNIQNPCECYCR